MEIQNNCLFLEFLMANFYLFGVPVGENRQELRINSACLQKHLIIPTIFSEFLRSCSCDQQNLRIIPRQSLRQSFPNSALCGLWRVQSRSPAISFAPTHLAEKPDSPKNCREPEAISTTVCPEWPLKLILSGAKKAGYSCPQGGVSSP